MSNLKVKTILVSQPEPKVENSPYFELQQKHKVKIDFRPFIHVEGVSAKDVRSQKIDLNNFTAIILNSRNSVDHFFRVAVPQTLNTLKVDWTQATFYKTVMSDLSDLADVYYDVLAFFSPTGIKSLFKNFPNFKQNNTRIAVFGSTTQKEALEHGLRIDILAPTPETPSMTMALEKYIADANKGK